jgi:hypothetical protein
MTTVLGIDVALKWQSIGSALLAFDADSSTFLELKAPAIRWPAETLTAGKLAEVIDEFARTVGVVAIAIDGPQGWRDPQTAPGTPGVGRRCEYEASTPAKTGVPRHTYPSTQRRWIEFSVELFDALLSKPDVRLARMEERGAIAPPGYALMECFPTSVWRAAGLAPLPAKSRRPDVDAYARRLRAAFQLPRPRTAFSSHDDLQASVAALVAAAFAGGPVVPRALGAPADARDTEWGDVRVEGFIWEAVPRDSGDNAVEPTVAPAGPTLTGHSGRVHVTQAVVDQVSRRGRSQAQIVLAGLPGGTSLERKHVEVMLGEEVYPLVIGDSHAAWARHQTGSAGEGFDRLFARLADAPGQLVSVTWRDGLQPATGMVPSGEHLASHGPPTPDSTDRTVSIPIQVRDGKIMEFDCASLPALADCIGELIVPAFAVAKLEDRQRFTTSTERELFPGGTPLLCRVSGRQVPAALLPKCRIESVPDSGIPGAFVEIVLEESLRLITRGTKRAVLARVSCVIPALDGLRATSLNEAYRRISERFEPRRRSVGGNVFRSIYHFEPSTASWRPIGELRGDIVFVPR